MSIGIDSISIKGFRKAHLRQLANYIYDADLSGVYYGNKEQFDKRHADLMELADRLERIATDADIRIIQ